MSTSDYQDIGTWIKRRRKQLGMTQQQLADRVGYSRALIRKVEYNDYGNLQDEAVERLADALAITCGSERIQFRRLARELRRREPSPEQSGTTGTTRGTTDNREDSTSSVIALPRKQEWLVAAMTILIGIVVGAMAYPILQSTNEVGRINLVKQADHFVRAETAQGLVTSGDTIAMGEVMTVTFTIRNNDSHAIRLRELIIGSRGPDVHTYEWGAEQQPFPKDINIMLQPGEQFQYRKSRSFSRPGDYFIEPIFKDAKGRWAGIEPFTRITFFVDHEPFNDE